VAWFRRMGVDQVAYHEATVLGREDDHPGQALDYYGSRGETPLRWGGAGAARLGLHGEVTAHAYRSAFGPGGFRDPVTGQQLARTRRPGFEVVVSAHKSLSLLGVLGRADDMHAILDAETAGTMAYLDAWAQTRGGRRGRAAVVTPTSGLVYAVTRHGTTRTGDPHVHDHVLIANVCEMHDTGGGYKALYSEPLPDLVEPAAMVGRLHSAAKAIELGYAIELDQGRSGRARDWRIVGIPVEVCEIFSKRSDQIAEYLEEMGYSSYRARNVAARRNRPVKRGTGTDELMPRWISELEAHGWSVERLVASLEDARRHCRGLARPLTDTEIHQLTADVLDPEGEFLARWKVFDRPRLVAEIDPCCMAIILPSWTESSTACSPRSWRCRSLASPVPTTSPTPPRPFSPPSTPSPTPSNASPADGRRSSHPTWWNRSRPRNRANSVVRSAAASAAPLSGSVVRGGPWTSSLGWPGRARPPPWMSPDGPSKRPATRCWARPPAGRRPAPSATRPVCRSGRCGRCCGDSTTAR
jgi:conjugative relaxase-like TrwC/TraI family protein